MIWDPYVSLLVDAFEHSKRSLYEDTRSFIIMNYGRSAFNSIQLEAFDRLFAQLPR